MIDKTRYKAVIFDLFHTITSLVHSKIAGRDTHDILGVDRMVWNDMLFHGSNERLRGEISDPIEIITDVAHKIDPSISLEKIKEAAASRSERFKNLLAGLLPNTIETIAALKEQGFKIGLVSNADKLERAGWEAGNAAHLFDVAIFSCDVGYVKPEREIYLACTEQLGVEPAECLFVGDGSCGELPGAQAVGMTAVFTSEFTQRLWPQVVEERLKEGKFDYHITNINQLLED